ncbi:hypothetical protein [Clostridium sp. OS1-26]|uniref:hypothetical protein n=1 Tax=Clostridium sp. OS1-26 TaxID=3070681 RepID=UPI0027DFA8EE|nr:hypothetical protein [Clostridium sp. OS1-26]WML33542.1 hypothetical protein RCG18_19650 [Clostridium sp. OS1-26]
MGYSELDEDFIIQGNSEERIIQLFSNEKIRELLEMQSSINLKIKDDEGFLQIIFQAM